MRSEEETRRLLRGTNLALQVAAMYENERLILLLTGQQTALQRILGERPLPKTCADDYLNRLEEELVMWRDKA